MAVLTGLEPKSVMKFFEEIASIPHGSGDTKRISDYCADFAKERGLWYLQDENNNIVIRKDGTAGREAHPYVMLQGHLDMVCEKEEGCLIDFTKDGLELEVKDGKISAKGTTLGGDDGIAIAYALAILDSDSIEHPPIEAVFTVDEEIGLLGASALDMSVLKSKYMINLDSEDEGYLLVSCAGGATANCSLPVKREAFDGVMLTITADGLLGGHSGQEIHKGRANSSMLLGRVLSNVFSKISFRLVSISGGNKDNAIPRSTSAVIAVKNEEEAEKISAVVSGLLKVISAEYSVTDPDIRLRTEKTTEAPGMLPMDEESTKRVIYMLRLFPAGVQRMSPNIAELVQTSLNLGVLRTEEACVTSAFSVRSSVDSEKDELIGRIASVMNVLGGTLSLSGVYPAWAYREDSKLRDIMVEVYKELYRKDMVVYAIHAGVECGLFCGAMKDLDAVSIGPDMKDIHTTAETLDIGSVQRSWEYLLEVLKRL